MIVLEENNKSTKNLQEMFVNVLPSLPSNIESSIYYAKLRNLLHSEIITFTKEQYELKEDLNMLRINIGENLSEDFIRDYAEDLKAKYNNTNNNIGIEYNIEQSRVDFSLCVFCIIKRDSIYCKKFIFRFRKGPTSGLEGISNSGIIEESSKFDSLFSNFKKKS